MYRKSLVLVAAFLLIALAVAGCKKKSEKVDVVSMDQARQEAEKEITESNLDDELDRMEKEISADE